MPASSKPPFPSMATPQRTSNSNGIRPNPPLSQLLKIAKALTIFAVGILLLLLVVFLALGLDYLMVPPPEIQLDSSAGSVSGNWNMSFLVNKPSGPTRKVELDVFILYKNQPLSQASVPPFQLVDKHTLVNATTVLLEGHVGDDIAKGVMEDVKEHGSVDFGVDVVATEMYKGGGTSEWKYACGDIGVRFSYDGRDSIGTMVGGRTACKRLTKWKFFWK